MFSHWRRNHHPLLLVSSLFFCFFSGNDHGVQGATLVVPTTFSTVAAAIAAASEGDTIAIVEDITETNINIGTDGLTIQGLGMGLTTITGGGAGGNSVVFRPNANDITIQDLTIDGCIEAFLYSQAGKNLDSNTINRVETTCNKGIQYESTTLVTRMRVTECVFDGSLIPLGSQDEGIAVTGAATLQDIIIQDCLFLDKDFGFWATSFGGGTATIVGAIITGNTFQSTRIVSIFINFMRFGKIESNTFMDGDVDVIISHQYRADEMPTIISDIVITKNKSINTSMNCFRLQNGEDQDGAATAFDGIVISNNECHMLQDDVTRVPVPVFVAPYGGSGAVTGLGWDTVQIYCNNFIGEYDYGVEVQDLRDDPDTFFGPLLAGGNYWRGECPDFVDSLQESLVVIDNVLYEPADSTCFQDLVAEDIATFSCPFDGPCSVSDRCTPDGTKFDDDDEGFYIHKGSGDSACFRKCVLSAEVDYFKKIGWSCGDC